MQQVSLDVDKNYIIYCTGHIGEKIAFACFAKNIKVLGFIDNFTNEKEYLNLPVYCYEDVRKKYKGEVIIVCNATQETEIFETLIFDGMKKGVDFFSGVELLNDRFFTESDIKEGIETFIKENECIITGDKASVRLFCDYGKRHGWNHIVPCFSNDDLNMAVEEHPSAYWVLLYDSFKYVVGASSGLEEDRKQRISYLKKKGVKRILHYGPTIVQNPFFYAVGKGHERTYEGLDAVLEQKFHVIVDSLVISITEGFSGNIFLNSVLNGHPQIADMGYSIWGFNIFFITEFLLDSDDVAEDWVKLLVSVPEYKKDFEPYKERYRKIAIKYFEKGRKYSEKDIFIGIFLIRYEFTHNKEATDHINLYMDPHIGRFHIESIKALCDRCEIPIRYIKCIRRPISQAGSALDYFIHTYGVQSEQIMNYSVASFGYELKEDWMNGCLTIRFRFEDLKTEPKKTTHKICDALGIEWDQSMLLTTIDDKEMVYKVDGRSQVRGYDVKPAWNTYEKYFNGFDRFRLSLLYRLKCQAYDYSSINLEDLPKEIVSFSELFFLPWQFEEYIGLETEDERYTYRNRLGQECERLLNEQRNLNNYEDKFTFGNYLHIECGEEMH